MPEFERRSLTIMKTIVPPQSYGHTTVHCLYNLKITQLANEANHYYDSQLYKRMHTGAQDSFQ